MPLTERREVFLGWLAPFVIVAAVWGCGPQRDNGLRLALLPAGSSAVLLAECQGLAVLFGGGDMGFARYELAPWLLERGVRRLDLVIMPRPVAAEAGGLIYILERFAVGELWVNVGQHRGSLYDDVISIAKKKSIGFKVVAHGDLFRKNDFIIRVLNPSERQLWPAGKLDPDLHSIVIGMSDKRMQTLIVPKIDPRAQRALGAEGRAPRLIIQTASQRLEPLLFAATRPRLTLTAQPQDWSGGSQICWRNESLVEVGRRPDGLLVKLGSFKADGYHERVLTMPVTRGRVSDER
jgi:hypothetical protein